MPVHRFLSEEFLECKRYWVSFALVVFSALFYLPGLGTRDLWAPGEPIYGEVIRAMYERNDWLAPMLNGQIYADKPVLYFWLALIVSKIAGGVNEWTVRLPAAMGGLGLVLVTYQFGKTFYDRQMGLLSALVLATSSRMLWESRFLRLDTVLSFFLFLGFHFWLKAFTKKGTQTQLSAWLLVLRFSNTHQGTARFRGSRVSRFKSHFDFSTLAGNPRAASRCRLHLGGFGAGPLAFAASLERRGPMAKRFHLDT